MIVDECSMNCTQSTINSSSEVNFLVEEYERISSTEASEAQTAKLKEILDKLKKYESENSLLSDLITEIENKLKLQETFSEQEKEINTMIEKTATASSEGLSNYTYATYNKYEDEEKEGDFPKLSLKWINKFLCSNYKLYYRTHELNEVLYFHFKGFRSIENMDTFLNLKVLYMEGNAIRKIQGLDKLVNLVSLYLHQNVIEKIEGLDNLKMLYNLNLSENCITKIENLDQLPCLNNLLLKGNRIGSNGLEDLEGLKDLKAVTVVDLSENRIEDPLVKDIFPLIATLRVIYLQGNECLRKISFYRKTMISSLKELRYLDDKPVFEDERRFAEAFAKGGLEEERRERDLYKKEKQESELKRINDFRDMIDEWKGQSKTQEDKSTVDDQAKEEQRRKLLMKCKNKTADTTEEKKDKNFDDNYELPDLETAKKKKEEGYIDYVLNSENANTIDDKFNELD